MTLTPSEVASLASSMSWWEASEYVSEGLVAVACAGEYVADFTNLFTKGTEKRKQRLAKSSTLALIFALSVELLCLVRTNQISGRLLGSLADKSDEAYRKSGVALSNADSAIGNAKTASDEARAAESLARAARQEADAFEEKLTSADAKAEQLRRRFSASSPW
jgi:hypothetical protein